MNISKDEVLNILRESPILVAEKAFILFAKICG